METGRQDASITLQFTGFLGLTFSLCFFLILVVGDTEGQTGPETDRRKKNRRW